MQVIFDHAKAETDTIQTFFFKPVKSVHYTAGQFIELSIPHKNPDDRGNKRWFTLSSAPEDEFLTITTKFATERSSSYKQALRHLPVGIELNMADPMGDFVLPKLIQTPLVFVAGGIGITPYHSMASWLSKTKETRLIKLLYSVSNEDEIIFQHTFEKANIHSTVVVKEPSAAWGGERGRISAELILGLEKPSEDTLVYISGPEPMVESLEKNLKKAGVSKQQIVTDSFPNYSVI